MLTVSGQFCRYLQGAAFMLLKGTFGTPDGTPNWSSSEPRRPKGAWCHLQCRHASRAGALRHFNIKSVISGPPQLTSDLNGQGFVEAYIVLTPKTWIDLQHSATSQKIQIDKSSSHISGQGNTKQTWARPGAPAATRRWCSLLTMRSPL